MADPLLYDEQAELAVLSSLALTPTSRLMDDLGDELEPKHFGRRHHELVFTAMRRLHATGRPVDLVTLKDELLSMRCFEDAGGVIFLAALSDGSHRSANIRHHAAIVRDYWLRRELRNRARRLATDAESGEVGGAELLEKVEADLHALGTTAVRTDWVSGAELAGELRTALEEYHAHRNEVRGVPTGFLDVDRDTRGLQPGDLVLLGARPSMGKTAIALQIALHAAQRVPVAFFSLEMARLPIGLRGVVATANVDGWRLLHGRLSDMDQRLASDGITAIGESQFHIDESPMLSPVQARAKLRRLQSRIGQPIGLVVIDYMQLMAPMPDDRRENKTNQVSGISRAVKLMAREFNVPFLALSQLNRGLERSGDKRPTLSDLRDSGALEQDADLVLLLHRPEVYEPTKVELKGLAELIVAKQRNGPTGTVELTWRADQMRFTNRAPEFAA